MLIDYVARRYNWRSFSIVRSLFEGLQATGHTVRFRKRIPAKTDADFVMLASSLIPLSRTNAPFVVLGLSDPAHYDKKRSAAADLYITASIRLSERFGFPLLPLWADPEYFAPVESAREADCVFLGMGSHRWVPEREKMAAAIRAAGLHLLIFGREWPDHPDNHSFVEGADLIQAYCSAKVLVDFSNGATSISSRIFQAMLCGTPVATADRLDIRSLFEAGKEIAVFKDKSFIPTVLRLLRHDKIRSGMAAAGRAACLARHSTVHRVATLLEILQGFSK